MALLRWAYREPLPEEAGRAKCDAQLMAPERAAAMLHAGGTIVDALPHGSFFHATAGAVGMGVRDRLRLFPYGEIVGATTMICRLVVGKYPKYRDVIPQNNANVLKIDRTLLLNTVRRVAVCSNKASNHIKFTLKEGQLEVSAQDLGFALAAYEKINCDYSGDELTIGFKSTFLTEILSNMGCNGVVIKFADARRAALILPSEEEAESEKICGILMPIMIS